MDESQNQIEIYNTSNLLGARLAKKAKEIFLKISQGNLSSKITVAILVIAAILTPNIALKPTLFGLRASNGSSSSSTLATINVDFTNTQGNISPLLYGQATNYTEGLADKMYSDISTKTLYPGVLSYLKDTLSPTIIRGGAGLDSRFYHWTNGIGPISSRPSTRQIEANVNFVNKFGTDEYMDFVNKLGAQPIMIVNNNEYYDNTVHATAQEAAAWVSYVNGDPSNNTNIGVDRYSVDWKTVGFWAQKRVDNGHTSPYGLKYWEIGNEDFGSGWDGNNYGDHFNGIVSKMKAVDPSIKVGAVANNTGITDNTWNNEVFSKVNSTADFVITHNYLEAELTTIKRWSNGEITKSITLPQAGSYNFSFYALSSGSGNNLTVKIDGNNVFSTALDNNIILLHFLHPKYLQAPILYHSVILIPMEVISS